MSNKLIIYHDSCADGFCAAWLCRKAFPDAELIACNYNMPPPDVSGKDVMVVDFSFKRPVLMDMKAKASSLIVLDHHKTAQEDLAGLDFCTFNMNKSGAKLTWEHLFTGDPHWLVDYTEDRDLWLHKLPYTREINAALRSIPMDFAAWDEISKKDPSELVNEGAAILRYQEGIIASHVAKAKEIIMDGHTVLCVNCTCGEVISEVAGKLAKGRPFGVSWFEDDGVMFFSLRSTDEGLDVSIIAKSRGGGGHRNAAGFRASRDCGS